MKEESCLTNLVAFCGEMTGLEDENTGSSLSQA